MTKRVLILVMAMASVAFCFASCGNKDFAQTKVTVTDIQLEDMGVVGMYPEKILFQTEAGKKIKADMNDIFSSETIQTKISGTVGADGKSYAATITFFDENSVPTTIEIGTQVYIEKTDGKYIVSNAE